jgi:hypothetical protein
MVIKTRDVGLGGNLETSTMRCWWWTQIGHRKLKITHHQLAVPEPLPAYKFGQLTALDKVSNSSGQNLLFADRFTDILSIFTFTHTMNS